MRLTPTINQMIDIVEEIAAVEGVDGVFIGPADLSADLGRHNKWAEPDVWNVILETGRRIKAAYVEADPRDQGARAALNLGHTFAHAIEAVSGYSISHGRAVAVGLVAAARLGASLGITNEGVAPRLASVLERHGLATSSPVSDGEALALAMSADKKRRGSRNVFIVPAERGVALVEGVPTNAALAALLERREDASP